MDILNIVTNSFMKSVLLASMQSVTPSHLIDTNQFEALSTEAAAKPEFQGAGQILWEAYAVHKSLKKITKFLRCKINRPC